MTLDTHDISALEIFLLNQYTYPGPNLIEVEPGDNVIDAGACWGDSAIYFATKAAPDGHVFAFEMSQYNIDILKSEICGPIRTLQTRYRWSAGLYGLIALRISGFMMLARPPVSQAKIAAGKN